MLVRITTLQAQTTTYLHAVQKDTQSAAKYLPLSSADLRNCEASTDTSSTGSNQSVTSNHRITTGFL